MSSRNIAILLIFCCAIVSFSSCKKIDNYLDEKGKLSDVNPSTLADFQAIMNNTLITNRSCPSIGLVGADNFYLSDVDFNATGEIEQRAYLWADNVFSNSTYGSGDWNSAYQLIEYCNIVLDGLKSIRINSGNQIEYEHIKGQAYFFRSFAYYMLSQTFCKPYSKASSEKDLGLILRTNSDINLRSKRATVEKTYQTVITDLKNAIGLLLPSSNTNTQPTQPAANALLSKVYLSMADYSHALKYATACLDQYNLLLDFNDNSVVSKNRTYRFPEFRQNDEIIWYAQAGGDNFLIAWPYPFSLGNVDSVLYRSYAENDLRKSIFYEKNGNSIKYRGSYTGNPYNFSGIAVNEILLIKTECEVRLGKIQDALNDLNRLLIKRYKTGTFNRITEQNPEKLLNLVISERRKELPFTGQLRWEDLRRLNNDSRFSDTLTRVIDGKTYTLLPNSSGYVYPIPYNEIELSDVQQNER